MSGSNEISGNDLDVIEPSVPSVPTSISGIVLPSVRRPVRPNPKSTRRVRSSGSAPTRKSIRHRTLDRMSARVTTENSPESTSNHDVEDSGLGDQLLSDEGTHSADNQNIESNESESDHHNEDRNVEQDQSQTEERVQVTSSADGIDANNTNTANNEINVCIDLTEDDSFVTENNADSDAEIECISTVIKTTDVCILRDTQRRRNHQNRTEIPPSPARNDEIIEISDFRNSNHSQPKVTPNRSSSPKSNANNSVKKSIKCPVCLDEYSMFNVSGKQLMSTNCGHLFCDSCIKQVVRTTKSCPSCRKKIATHKSYHPIYL